MDLAYFLSLEFSSKVSLALAFIAIFYAVSQIKDYYKVFTNPELDKDTKIHTFKIIVLVCGIVGFCISVLLYSSNILIFDGAQPFRVALKWLQNFSIAGIIYGLHGLKKYYIDRK